MIENYERMIGFDLELRSLRLSFKEWEQLVPEDQLNTTGMGIVFDSETADRLARLQ